jgi:hypothetical protein
MRIAHKHPYLEMDARASMARMSLTPGMDFEHVGDEERHRMDCMARLREFNMSLTGREINTQRRRNQFTDTWNSMEEMAWTA